MQVIQVMRVIQLIQVMLYADSICLRCLTQGEWSQVSKWIVRYVAFQLPPMQGKVAKIHDSQKTCRYFQTS